MCNGASCYTNLWTFLYTQRQNQENVADFPSISFRFRKHVTFCVMCTRGGVLSSFGYFRVPNLYDSLLNYYLFIFFFKKILLLILIQCSTQIVSHYRDSNILIHCLIILYCWLRRFHFKLLQTILLKNMFYLFPSPIFPVLVGISFSFSK